MKRIVALLLLVVFTFCIIPKVPVVAADKTTSAIEILKELGAQNPTVVDKSRAAALGDNLVKDPATVIEFNDTSYAFLDDGGDIIRIKRVDEIRSLKNANESKSKFKSIDTLRSYIEETLIGDEYELVKEYYFSEETLSLRYEKILFPGAYDSYDYVSVRIRTSVIELETFYRVDNGFELHKDTKVIPKEKAIAIANNVLGTGEKITDVRLATVKSNGSFGSTVRENVIHLAYNVSTASRVVYVDAYTGDVVGGDIYKSVLGGAIGAIELQMAPNSIALAKTMLESMGYVTTNTSLSAQFATAVPSLLKPAFYACSHGSEITIASSENESDPNRRFYFYNVPSGTYKFVFLDACSTASIEWKSAFGISNSSTNKAFLGWEDRVNEIAAYNFCLNLWSYISPSYTVYEAAMDANDYGENTWIQFTGDMSYDGYY